MSAAIRKEYPSLAEIVRQETDGGRLIVQFYLGVAYGEIEGFRDYHRAAAARRIDKIAPGLVKEYLLNYHNAQVRESMRASMFPMGSKAPTEKESPEPVLSSAEGRRRPGSNAFQRRLRKLVREETADGRSIVLFLIGVMDGTITGFKPHHRLEAAKELASYVTHAPSPSMGWDWGDGDSSPSPSTGEGRGEGDSPAAATKPATQNRANPPVTPADAGVQRGGVGRGSQSPTRNFPPITIEELERFDFTREHAARYNFARDEIPGGIYGYDELGPFVADEEGGIHHIDPSRVAGYERVVRRSPAAPERSATRSGRGRRGSRPSQAKDRNPKTRTSPHPRTLNRRRKNPNAQSRNLKAATGSPLSTPGRSPPKIRV